MELFNQILLMLGTVSFAASGALLAIRKGMDIFGVAMMGTVTAVGGGILRDVTLGSTPPAIFSTPEFILAAIGVSLLLFLPRLRRAIVDNHRGFEIFMLLADSIGLGMFTVHGVQTALLAGADSLLLVLFVSVLTGVGGGVLRDLLSGERPYIFMKHFYACASLIGALVTYLLWNVLGGGYAMAIGFVLILAMRLLAAKYHWSLPRA